LVIEIAAGRSRRASLTLVRISLERVTGDSLRRHGWSGTAYIVYNFGWVNPADIGPGDAEASAMIRGLNNIRVYTDATTYTSMD